MDKSTPSKKTSSPIIPKKIYTTICNLIKNNTFLKAIKITISEPMSSSQKQPTLSIEVKFHTNPYIRSYYIICDSISEGLSKIITDISKVPKK